MTSPPNPDEPRRLRPGARFLHTRYLDTTRPGHQPAECVITRVTGGTVYYRVGGPAGAKVFIDRSNFPDIVLEWLPPAPRGDRSARSG